MDSVIHFGIILNLKKKGSFLSILVIPSFIIEDYLWRETVHSLANEVPTTSHQPIDAVYASQTVYTHLWASKRDFGNQRVTSQ